MQKKASERQKIRLCYKGVGRRFSSLDSRFQAFIGPQLPHYHRYLKSVEGD